MPRTAMPITTDPQRPFLVTLIAGSIGIMHIGVSIFAVWLIWFIPTARTPMPESKKKVDKSRRRSAPPGLLSVSQQSPLVIPIILSTTSIPSSPNRKVYFLDQVHSRHARRNSAPPEATFPEPEDYSDSSPLSSSSTLSSGPLSRQVKGLSPTIPEAGESSNDSDSSRRSSLVSLPKLPKMKIPLGGGKKTRKVSVVTIKEAVPHAARSSSISGFIDMWQRSRPQISQDTSKILVNGGPAQHPASRNRVASSPQSTSHPLDATTSLLSFKSTRKSLDSSPVPRTQPYLHPYCAAPPTRQSQDEAKSSIEDDPLHDRSTMVLQLPSRKANADAQASLGYGRRLQGRRIVSALP